VAALSLGQLTQKFGDVNGHKFETDLASMVEFQVMFDGTVGPLSHAFLAQIAGLNIIEPELWLDGKERLNETDSPDRVFATFQAGSAFLLGKVNPKGEPDKKELFRRTEAFFALAESFSADLTYTATQQIIRCGDMSEMTRGPNATRATSKFNRLSSMALGR
jgi:hypothetical protein